MGGGGRKGGKERGRKRGEQARVKVESGMEANRKSIGGRKD